jgi:peptidoglycan/LPS O-acetylase OafA/YrhL
MLDNTLMTAYSELGYLISISIFLLFISLPIFSSADRPWYPDSARAATIDGLRGFLATGVFFHHALIYYSYLADGKWALPPSNFFIQLGQSGVTLFFMITGYLFWGKIISSNYSINWIGLYINRAFRIGPLYFLTMVLMLLIVFASANFKLIDPVATVIRQIAPLLALGWHTPGSRINGYEQPWILIAGVTWTLHYEWIFYLLMLPVSSFVSRFLRNPLILPLAALTFWLGRQYIHPSTGNFGFAAFSVGMACAALRSRGWIGINNKNADMLWSVILAGLFISLFHMNTSYSLHAFFILIFIFVLISAGTSMFGLLHARPAKRLGEISYGIYILQGLALFSILRQPWVNEHLISSILGYWLCVVVAGMFLISVAMLAHVTLERPGINLGRRISAGVSKGVVLCRVQH